MQNENLELQNDVELEELFQVEELEQRFEMKKGWIIPNEPGDPKGTGVTVPFG